VRTLLRLVLACCAGVASAQSANFNFYASPVKLYQCIGYSTSKCIGFETGLATHWVDYVKLNVTSANPLQFQVTIMVNSQVYQAFNQPADMSSPFVVAATDGSGLTATVTLSYVKTLHCVGTGASRHCTDRYLPEAGTVSLP
jgi:hypothetical protein